MSQSPEAPRGALSATQAADVRVFQPAKLTEIVEMIDLMGQLSERVREDSSGDMGGAGMQATRQAGQASAVSARDLAIANLPASAVMQTKLVTHIKIKIKELDSQARTLARSASRGSAYMLNEIYKRIRRYTAMIEEILTASVEIVRRFYIAVFIDRQVLLVTADASTRSAA